MFEGDDEYFDDEGDDEDRPRSAGVGRGRGGRGGMPGMGMGPGGPMAPGGGYGMRPGMMQMGERQRCASQGDSWVGWWVCSDTNSRLVLYPLMRHQGPSSV